MSNQPCFQAVEGTGVLRGETHEQLEPKPHAVAEEEGSKVLRIRLAGCSNLSDHAAI